jgi:hypothetical protein
MAPDLESNARKFEEDWALRQISLSRQMYFSTIDQEAVVVASAELPSFSRASTKFVTHQAT